MGTYDFKIGDILYDTISKDIGILISRFDNGNVMREHDFYLWVWEVYWTRELYYGKFTGHVSFTNSIRKMG